LALFGYHYKPLIDGNKLKFYLNASIIFQLLGKWLSSESAKQRECRFSRTRSWARLSVKRDLFLEILGVTCVTGSQIITQGGIFFYIVGKIIPA
jgi:hypothetical protein